MLRLSNRRLTNTLCHSIKSRWVSTNSNNAAYEEALKLIALDKRERLEMLSRVEKEVARVTKDTSSPTQTAQLAALNSLKFDLQVKAELNDPEIRQNFDNNNNVDMSRPVYRYLTERQFQKLPRKKLMERITQMNVMPDLVDLDINPTVDLKLKFANDNDNIVEPGVFTLPEHSITLPNIELTNFHTETKLYTLLLVDPDSPDAENKTYQQYCHWLTTNVPLSATESIVKGGNTILNYVPPHPQKGTKAHRYTFIAYEQTKELKDIESNIQRDHFDVKLFAKQNELNVRGIHFFRQKWDESVSKIYNDILQTKEPIYGKPSRQEPYIQRTMYF